ncbi:MAG TPA: ABC transporter permease [Byssovorax sp.]|jgi:ABC-type dipeptide/oligopeptide/nickel transport system permease component
MLRHAFRRFLWTLPTLVGISIASFWFLSYVPDPVEDAAMQLHTAPAVLARVRRERFLDLPRFLNLAPRDVTVRVDEAMAAIARGGVDAEVGARELARLGGAALPRIAPAFDALAPEPRARVAVALAPVAVRMGLPRADDAADPERAVSFWAQLWEDRGIEFRRSAARGVVSRLLRYHAPETVEDVRALDTFALPELFAALEPPDDAASLYRARTITSLLSDITGVDDRIEPAAGLDAGAACVARWIGFWNVYRTDFTELYGPSRVAAMALETRYGKWALGAISLRFGTSSTGAPVLDELLRRAPITVAVVLGAIWLAYLLAMPIAAIRAMHRGKRVDLAIACAVLGLYSVPTAAVALVVVRTTDRALGSLTAAIAVVAVGLVAAPAGQLRSSLASALEQDHVRAAEARGASRLRALVRHALPNALLPFITLSALEAPMALGGAFVVERVFGLRGVGELTIRAVQLRDTSWLMAISLVAGMSAALFVLTTDLLYVVVDRRVGRFVLQRRGEA